MKKSNTIWIVVGAAAACLTAFSAGVSYAMNQLKKIQAEDLSPDEEDPEEQKEDPQA